jgi:gamma-F420-2:alpha-L-glutamate ligase
MLEGWLLYHREDYVKNRWFAERLVERACAYGLDIRTVTDGQDAAGGPPAFAVNRTRDWALAARLERGGCRVFNPSETARIGNDKIESHALAARLGLPQMEFAACDNRPECLAAQRLGYPVVLKNPHGHGGSEVFLARDEGELLALAQKLTCGRVLLEKPCGRPGSDVRVYVLGGQILTAVKRVSPCDFRANLSLGGTAAYYGLNAREREMAERVIGAVPLDYAGIDFILDEDGGFLFNELEDAVGARSLYRLGGHDPAELFARYISGVAEGTISNDR